MPNGRSPRPEGGDPNTKAVRLTLTAADWRELRLRAAMDATSMQRVVSEIVRRELDRRPGRSGA
jgi:hypothetical protein